jgi:hypothetical protein
MTETISTNVCACEAAATRRREIGDLRRASDLLCLWQTPSAAAPDPAADAHNFAPSAITAQWRKERKKSRTGGGTLSCHRPA